MPRTSNPWLVLVLVCIAQFMVVLDATVVNVALPSIQRDLDMSSVDLQWVVNSYTLARDDPAPRARQRSGVHRRRGHQLVPSPVPRVGARRTAPGGGQQAVV
jgi:hypothetical protein